MTDRDDAARDDVREVQDAYTAKCKEANDWHRDRRIEIAQEYSRRLEEARREWIIAMAALGVPGFVGVNPDEPYKRGDE